MIEVTRLNGNRMIVNSDLIKIAEASPDTMLTLIQGEKLIIRESCEEIVEKVLVYRAQLLSAVAERSKNADLHRLVALASLNLDPATGAATTLAGKAAAASGLVSSSASGIHPVPSSAETPAR